MVEVIVFEALHQLMLDHRDRETVLDLYLWNLIIDLQLSNFKNSRSIQEELGSSSQAQGGPLTTFPYNLLFCSLKFLFHSSQLHVIFFLDSEDDSFLNPTCLVRNFLQRSNISGFSDRFCCLQIWSNLEACNSFLPDLLLLWRDNW